LKRSLALMLGVCVVATGIVAVAIAATHKHRHHRPRTVAMAVAADHPVATAHGCPGALSGPWRCATVSVPLDHGGKVPGRIRIAAALLHAPGPPRPAVVTFAGGPGAAAIPNAAGFRRRLAPLLAHRDLLVFDQRGTGVSAPISCPAIDADVRWTPQDVRRCAARLGASGAFQATDDVVADLQDVRAALHIPSFVLYGVSYGTKVAVDYARRDPRHVSAIVLDSPIVEDTDPFYRRSAAGASRVLENLCDEGDCVKGADPVQDLRTLIGRMRDGALPADRHVTEARLLHVIVEGHRRLTQLPVALHDAVGWNLGPLLAELPPVVPDSRSAPWMQSFGSHTVYLTTSCEDGDFPWSRSDTPKVRLAKARADVDRLGDRAFYPFDKVVGIQYGAARICAPWPDSGRRPTPPSLPGVPALILVGGDDDVAPLEGAREIAAGFSHPRMVVVAGSGHGVLHPTGEGQRALRSFAAALP
jgi:pimeloyl-ACP methyl ester carboxylesterase